MTTVMDLTTHSTVNINTGERWIAFVTIQHNVNDVSLHVASINSSTKSTDLLFEDISVQLTKVTIPPRSTGLIG
jgi:hypothetical protein